MTLHEQEKGNRSMTDRQAALVWGDPGSDSVWWTEAGYTVKTICGERRESSTSFTILSTVYLRLSLFVVYMLCIVLVGG